jgi:predicted HNH restriction endonuclease
MATQDDFIKTALRLPRGLHATIQAAAQGSGKSMNAEIIARLLSNPEAVAATTILAKLNELEDVLIETNKRQMDMLWKIIERADDALRKASVALGASQLEEETNILRSDVAVLLDLIDAVRVHR